MHVRYKNLALIILIAAVTLPTILNIATYVAGNSYAPFGTVRALNPQDNNATITATTETTSSTSSEETTSSTVVVETTTSTTEAVTSTTEVVTSTTESVTTENTTVVTTTTTESSTQTTTEYSVVFEVNPSGAGTTNPSDSGSYAAGSSIWIVATANSGYAFSSWSVSDPSAIGLSDPSSASTSATINGFGTITANFNPTTVQPADTQTVVDCSSGSVEVGGTVTCTATVTGGSSVSGQTVSWGSAGSGMFDSVECTLGDTGSCSVTYSPTDAGDGSHTLTANYAGDAAHNASTGNFTLTVTGSATITTTTVTSVTASGDAKIWTDKADYAPGDTPIIYGSGFLANAEVTVTVIRPEGTQNSWMVTADDSGSFTTSYATDALVEGTFTVSATDGTDTATTTFTDSRPLRFHETGLPSGTSWSVTVPDLSPSTKSSTTDEITFGGVAEGTSHPFTVSSPISGIGGQYVASPSSGQASVPTGTGPVTVEIVFNFVPSDSTPPVITPNVSCDNPGNAPWCKGTITVSWTVTDPESSVTSTSGCGTTMITSDTPSLGTTLTCQATSAGGTSSQSVTVYRDGTAPLVSCPSADTIWHANDQSVTCTATDGVSGPNSQSATLSTSVAGGVETDNAYTNSQSVCDVAGNCATAGPVGPFKIDKKAPTVTCAAADTSWHSTDQSVTCTATDAGSGPATQSVTLSTNVPTGSETDNAYTGSQLVSDNVGNSATAGPVGPFKIDKKAPDVSCGSADTSWHATDQSVTCTATDGGSGPASQTVTLSTNVAAGTETDNAFTDSQTVSDAVGNSATAGPVGPFKIDKKAPQVSCPSADTSWHANDQSVTCTATDGGSGPASQGVTLSTNVAPGTETDNAYTDSQAVLDNVGNTATAGPVGPFKIDKKAPDVSCPAADSDWHATDQFVTCTATDGGSGPATQSVTLSTGVLAGTETASAFTNSQTVYDSVGNSATAGPVGPFKIDKKAPDVSCGSADTSWHATDQSVACTATDGGSGPASQTATLTTSVPSGTETDTANTNSQSICDAVGNCATAGPVGPFKIDKKAPTVSCGSVDSIWHATDQSVTCTGTDGGSGPATQSITLSTSVAANTETSNAYTNSQNVCDAVDNCATAGPVGPFKIDKKGPTITMTVPTSGPYTLNQPVASSYSCTDGGSGVASCTGTVSNSANIDTGSVGSKSFTVNAADNVGNPATQTVTYAVQYSATCGHSVLQPLQQVTDPSGLTKRYKLGSTLPIKFQLCDYSGNKVGTATATLTSIVKVSNGVDLADVIIVLDSGSSNDNTNIFRYDPIAQQYIYNLSTKASSNLSQGTYRLVIQLDDGTQIITYFELSK